MVPLREQHILTDDEIIDIILKYIDEDIYNYAIMIDGEWGCGKTYFIKESSNSLISKIENHEKEKVENDKDYKARQVIYISLYGIKSVDEISKQVFVKSHFLKAENTTGIAKTGIRVIGTMLPFLYDIINDKFGTGLDADNVSDSLEKLLPSKENIFIFDDLERCDCHINELFGYINSLVEQNSLKVILVANQKEIGGSNYQTNQELKYLVAANPIIMFNDESANYEDYKLRQNGDNMICDIKLNIDTINRRVNRLFRSNIAFEYLKEKVIGKVIYYCPKLKEIILFLIQNNGMEVNLKNILSENTSFFDKYMSESEHLNIRTFQFFLSKIKDLYYAIDQFEIDAKKDFMHCIIQYTFMVCVDYKAGTYKYDWSENVEYREKNMESSDEQILSFRFVDDFVIKCILDIDKAKEMLTIYQNYYYKNNNQEFKLFSNLENNWRLYTDVEVEKAIQKIMRGLYENRYDPGIYANILNTLL